MSAVEEAPRRLPWPTKQSRALGAGPCLHLKGADLTLRPGKLHLASKESMQPWLRHYPQDGLPRCDAAEVVWAWSGVSKQTAPGPPRATHRQLQMSLLKCFQFPLPQPACAGATAGKGSAAQGATFSSTSGQHDFCALLSRRRLQPDVQHSCKDCFACTEQTIWQQHHPTTAPGSSFHS